MIGVACRNGMNLVKGGVYIYPIRSPYSIIPSAVQAFSRLTGIDTSNVFVRKANVSSKATLPGTGSLKKIRVKVSDVTKLVEATNLEVSIVCSLYTTR